MRTGCVILAGGQSCRIGSDKAELLYEGKTFLSLLSENFSPLEDKFIARGERPATEIPGWVSITDIYENCGPMAGLHAALTRCKSDRLICVSCDTPLIDLDFFADLSAALQPDMDAVIPVTANGQMHPLCGIYGKTCLPVLTQQLETGDYRMRSALSRLRVRFIAIEEGEQAKKLKNINTRDDYQEFINENI